MNLTASSCSCPSQRLRCGHQGSSSGCLQPSILFPPSFPPPSPHFPLAPRPSCICRVLQPPSFFSLPLFNGPSPGTPHPAPASLPTGQHLWAPYSFPSCFPSCCPSSPNHPFTPPLPPPLWVSAMRRSRQGSSGPRPCSTHPPRPSCPPPFRRLCRSCQGSSGHLAALSTGSGQLRRGAAAALIAEPAALGTVDRGAGASCATHTRSAPLVLVS